MFSLKSLCLAIGRSIVTRDAARQRREQAARDEEAELIAAKKARDERLEQERLDFYTAQIVKQARRA